MYLWTYYHCCCKFKFIIFPLLSSLCCLLIKLNYYHSLSNAEVVRQTVHYKAPLITPTHAWLYFICKNISDDNIVLFFAFSEQIKEGVFISFHCRNILCCLSSGYTCSHHNLCSFYVLDKIQKIVSRRKRIFSLFWFCCYATAGLELKLGYNETSHKNVKHEVFCPS